MLLILAVLLVGQDALAATGMGIKLPEDPTKAYITLGILVAAAVMFFTEIVPLPITALLVPVALSLTHVITSKVAFSYFGDPTVSLFMAMFIVGEATFITGFADKVGALAVRLSKGNTVLLLVYTMAAVGLLSTVLSNTGTTVVAVPMILGMCIKAKLAPGKVLMPVAFASSLGGTVTLVGTPPNGIINSMLAQTGQTPFGFFEFGLIGMPAKRKMVVQSTLRKASRMVMQPEMTIRQAPSMAAVVRGMSSLAIMKTTKAKMAMEYHILFSRRVWPSVTISSSIWRPSGRKRWPMRP